MPMIAWFPPANPSTSRRRQVLRHDPAEPDGAGLRLTASSVWLAGTPASTCSNGFGDRILLMICGQRRQASLPEPKAVGSNRAAGQGADSRIQHGRDTPGQTAPVAVVMLAVDAGRGSAQSLRRRGRTG